jgi:hypothetical protein
MAEVTAARPLFHFNIAITCDGTELALKASASALAARNTAIPPRDTNCLHAVRVRAFDIVAPIPNHHGIRWPHGFTGQNMGDQCRLVIQQSPSSEP